MYPNNLVNAFPRILTVFIVAISCDDSFASGLTECPDKTGYSYIIDYGWMYLTQDNFNASIWIQDVNNAKEHFAGQPDKLQKNLDGSKVFTQSPYALCSVTNLEGRPGRTGEADMTCTNIAGVQNNKENELNKMALGNFAGIPSKNGIPFNAVRQIYKHVYQCNTGILTVYASGYVVRGDIGKTNYLNEDEIFNNKIYFSKASWRPYGVKVLKNSPAKSNYKF